MVHGSRTKEGDDHVADQDDDDDKEEMSKSFEKFMKKGKCVYECGGNCDPDRPDFRARFERSIDFWRHVRKSHKDMTQDKVRREWPNFAVHREKTACRICRLKMDDDPGKLRRHLRLQHPGMSEKRYFALFVHHEQQKNARDDSEEVRKIQTDNRVPEDGSRLDTSASSRLSNSIMFDESIANNTADNNASFAPATPSTSAPAPVPSATATTLLQSDLLESRLTFKHNSVKTETETSHKSLQSYQDSRASRDKEPAAAVDVIKPVIKTEADETVAQSSSLSNSDVKNKFKARKSTGYLGKKSPKERKSREGVGTKTSQSHQEVAKESDIATTASNKLCAGALPRGSLSTAAYNLQNICKTEGNLTVKTETSRSPFNEAEQPNSDSSLAKKSPRKRKLGPASKTRNHRGTQSAEPSERPTPSTSRNRFKIIKCYSDVSFEDVPLKKEPEECDAYVSDQVKREPEECETSILTNNCSEQNPEASQISQPDHDERQETGLSLEPSQTSDHKSNHALSICYSSHRPENYRPEREAQILEGPNNQLVLSELPFLGSEQARKIIELPHLGLRYNKCKVECALCGVAKFRSINKCMEHLERHHDVVMGNDYAHLIKFHECASQLCRLCGVLVLADVSVMSQHLERCHQNKFNLLQYHAMFHTQDWMNATIPDAIVSFINCPLGECNEKIVHSSKAIESHLEKWHGSYPTDNLIAAVQLSVGAANSMVFLPFRPSETLTKAKVEENRPNAKSSISPLKRLSRREMTTLLAYSEASTESMPKQRKKKAHSKLKSGEKEAEKSSNSLDQPRFSDGGERLAPLRISKSRISQPNSNKKDGDMNHITQLNHDILESHGLSERIDEEVDSNEMIDKQSHSVLKLKVRCPDFVQGTTIIKRKCSEETELRDERKVKKYREREQREQISEKTLIETSMHPVNC